MSRIKLEIVYLLTAIMFFTRIPIPFQLPYSEAIMNQSQKYYAWVGLLVGLINAALFYIFHLLFGTAIAVVLMMGLSVLLTGAFHEDGFADSCDGFGGGYGKERILTIMKDSRMGAYGTIGIVLLLLAKYTSIVQLMDQSQMSFTVAAIIMAHSLSRFVSGTTLYTHQYVRDIDSSKVKPMAAIPLPWHTMLIGIVAISLVGCVSGYGWLLLSIIPAYIAKMALSAYFKKQIGGYTGDCLGAIQQVSELVIYLSSIVIWKYIY